MNKFITDDNELKVYEYSEDLYWAVINEEINVYDALEVAGCITTKKEGVKWMDRK